MRQSALKFGLAVAACGALAVLSACADGRATGRYYAVRTGGTAARGEQVIESKSCGSCHTIPGIRAARGVVGPPLFFFGRRTFIAGQLPNNPENLVRWVSDPQSVEPDTAMPNLGLTNQQAKDVAAYLYSLR